MKPHFNPRGIKPHPTPRSMGRLGDKFLSPLMGALDEVKPLATQKYHGETSPKSLKLRLKRNIKKQFPLVLPPLVLAPKKPDTPDQDKKTGQ